MCGIAGFSLSPNESVNSKRIAKAMLLAIEHRGPDATGFAFTDSTGQFQVHKQDLTASKFIPKRLCMPKNIRTAIMHTRFATQGHEMYNENNHPILANHVVGVHNGHISNDTALFAEVNKIIGGNVRVGEVDSEAVFALLGYLDNPITEVLEEVAGGAAIAWLDDTDTNRNTLHLARLNQSPLIVGQTASGSVLFASTVDAVKAGAAAAGFDLEMVRVIAEGSYLTIIDGFIENVQTFQPLRYFTSRYTPAKTSGVVSKSSGYTKVTDMRAISGGRGNSGITDRMAGEYDFSTDRMAGENDFFADGERGWNDADSNIMTQEDYDAWAEENSDALDAALVREDDDDDWAPSTQSEFEEFFRAPNVNTYYLSHPEYEILRESESAYLRNDRHVNREVAVEKWLSHLKTSDANKAVLVTDLKALARPGDAVSTMLNGEVFDGHIQAVPGQFPGGDFIIRLYVMNERRLNGCEAILVTRRASEFNVNPSASQGALALEAK